MWLTKCIPCSVLRISVEPGSDALTIRLDGKVIGAWVEECQRAWRELRPNLGSKKVRLDLRNVTFVDERGTDLLREIHRTSGAEILADSPLTKYFAERIMREEEKKGV